MLNVLCSLHNKKWELLKNNKKYLICHRSCVSRDCSARANQAVYRKFGAVYGSDGGGVSSITTITLTLDLTKTINERGNEDGH
jgi:hypothetical protein